jgi:signal transduction histidine kinase
MSNIEVSITNASQLTDKGRKKLLSITYKRLVFGITSIPFVGAAFVAWSINENTFTLLLSIWWLYYVLAAVFINFQNKKFSHELETLESSMFLAKWNPVVHKIALIHGTTLGSIVILTSGRNSFEFSLLLHISLAAIIAANASHQTPVLSSFLRFFLSCWGITLVFIPWTYPNQWQYIFPLSVIYLLAIYRHAKGVHLFFLHQVGLEEATIKIAEQYRHEKNRAEEALQAKNQFLQIASHDLRQPVQAMSFLIESIVRRNNNTELTPALNDLRSSIQSINFMFNSLLDLSKLESGNISVKKSPIYIDSFIKDIFILFNEEASSRGLTLKIHTPKKLTLVSDPSLLRQAMMNLIHNALRYTLKGGVLIAVRKRQSTWRFEIWDTGIGIASNEQKNIYSPYYRNEHAWQLDNAGHGLGLAVVARCANLLGATYGVNSALGKGSCFWLSIPNTDIITHKETSIYLLSEYQNSLPRLSGTCLMVDDDPMITRAFADLMQTWGVIAKTADSGQAALSILQQGFKPYIIFCDQRLRSGESGFEVLKDLLEKCPNAKGAMISGEYHSPELLQAEDEGYLVLTKPLQVAQMHAVISNLLANTTGIS